MTSPTLSIGPHHTLREASRLMSIRRFGATLIIDRKHGEIGILTERDVLDSIGAGQSPDMELASSHCTNEVVFAGPGWTLEQTATTMIHSGFRHLPVLEAGEITGLVSMRDVVRVWVAEPGKLVGTVRNGLTRLVATIGLAHTIRDAARVMSGRRVGAALVINPAHRKIGILTERDVLDSIGAGQSPDMELASSHCTNEVVFAGPGWTLEQTATTMIHSGFRHLPVLEAGEITGLVSMRDVVRVWAESNAERQKPHNRSLREIALTAQLTI